MNAMITTSHPLMHFTAVSSDVAFAHDVAQHLSRGEVDALTGLFKALGEMATADLWISSHATTDDSGDLHYLDPTSDYVVPIDPIGDLQCDSCQ